jgi:hypothetical protein
MFRKPRNSSQTIVLNAQYVSKNFMHPHAPIRLCLRNVNIIIPIDHLLSSGYNTRSIHEDAEQALSATAEGHWRK